MTYSHDDPSLKTEDGGLTVWTLQDMARESRFDELQNMFNNGLNMDSLPVGVSAGAGLATSDLAGKFFPKLLDFLTFESEHIKVSTKELVRDATEYFVGKNWRGKIFFPSNNKRVSKGRNRIKEN